MVNAVVAFNGLSVDFLVDRAANSRDEIVIGRFRTPRP
jgi:hypothetical protein